MYVLMEDDDFDESEKMSCLLTVKPITQLISCCSACMLQQWPPSFLCFPVEDHSDYELTFSIILKHFTAKQAHACSGYTDFAVENHNIVGIWGQPRLHGLTSGTNPIKRRGVKIGPAVVLHLVHRWRLRTFFFVLQQILPSTVYAFP